MTVSCFRSNIDCVVWPWRNSGPSAYFPKVQCCHCINCSKLWWREVKRTKKNRGKYSIYNAVSLCVWESVYTCTQVYFKSVCTVWRGVCVLKTMLCVSFKLLAWTFLRLHPQMYMYNTCSTGYALVHHLWTYVHIYSQLRGQMGTVPDKRGSVCPVVKYGDERQRGESSSLMQRFKDLVSVSSSELQQTQRRWPADPPTPHPIFTMSPQRCTIKCKK